MIKKDRLVTIDLLRGIAVILMFITHSYRLQMMNTGDWLPNQLKLDYFFNIFMYIEPLTSALFLFLAGYSFSLLNQKLTHDELKKQILKKSLILIFFSWIINLALYSGKGLFLDHLVLSSGILQAIAISLIMNLLLSKKNKYLYLGIALTIIIEIFLEFFKISVIGLNAGAGALIPVIGYSFVGHIYQKHNFKYNTLLFAIVLIGLFLNLNWRYDVEYQIFNLIQNKYTLFSNWNHSALGFIMNSATIILIFRLISVLKIKRTIPIIKDLGGHSLTVYVFHLLLISFFYYKSWGLANPTETLLFIIGLVTCSHYLIKMKLFIFGR